jgi:DNA-binding transcriptional ArsR family regulator
MFFALGSDFGVGIGFNAGKSLTQIFWRIVEAAVKSGASTPDSASGQTPRVDFVSPQLAAALAHPTRVGVMSVLVEGPASPRQLAEAIDEPLNNVTYHVKQLRDLGCIELDRTERRAGGRVIERFYRASQRAYFDDAAWEVLSPGERLGVIWSVIRLISKDIDTAMTSGTFFDGYDANITRSPMSVDPEGWEEITDLIGRVTRELFEIEERVAERCEGGAEPDVHAKVEILHFRSPAPR